jgi:hypothetical protein
MDLVQIMLTRTLTTLARFARKAAVVAVIAGMVGSMAPLQAIAQTVPPTTITIIKSVTNDTIIGGTPVGVATLADFQFGIDNVPLALDAEVLTATTVVPVTPGTHSVDILASYPGYGSNTFGDCVFGQVTVAEGANATCTIEFNDLTNSGNRSLITINHTVINDDGGTATSGSFQSFVFGTPLKNATPTALTSSARFIGSGVIDIVHSAVAGYVSTFGGACDSTGRIVIPNTANSLTCTITSNDLPGSGTGTTLTLQRTVLNDDGGTATLADASFFLSLGNVQLPADAAVLSATSIIDVPAAANLLLVAPPAGYRVTFTGACASPANFPNDADFTAIANQNILCSVLLDDLDYDFGDGAIRVLQVLTNDDGGTATFADFDTRLDGTLLDFPFAATSTFEDTQFFTAAGTHTVTSAAVAGYTTTFSGACAPSGSATLPASTEVFCTVTHDDVAAATTGTITVNLQVINDNGTGDLDTSEIPFFIDGVQQAAPAPGNDLSTYTQTVAPGDHTLSVVPFLYYNYNVGLQGTCTNLSTTQTLSVAAGQNVTCNVFFDDLDPAHPNTAHSTFVTRVINDNGGTATADDFTIRIKSTSFGFAQAVLPGVLPLPLINPAVSGNAATYAISAQNGSDILVADAFPGYTVSAFSGDCAADGNIIISTAADTTCEVTYNDIPRTAVSITLTVINDNGTGNLDASQIPVFLDGVQLAAPAPGTLTHTTITDVVAGEHVIRLIPFLYYNYNVGLAGNCGNTGGQPITVAQDTIHVCQIFFDDLDPNSPNVAHLTFNAHVINDDFGTATPDDFTIRIKSTSFGFAQAVLPGVQPLPLINPVVTGNTATYAVTGQNGSVIMVADAFPGYVASAFSGDCAADGNLILLGNVTCDITFDDDGSAPIPQSTLTIQSTITNDNLGDNDFADFQFLLDGAAQAAGNAGELTFTRVIPVDPGAHTIGMNPALPQYGVGLPGSDCFSSNGIQVNVPVGGNATCIILFDDLAPSASTGHVTITKRVVNNNGGTTLAPEFELFLKSTSFGGPALKNPIVTGDEAVYELDVNAGTYVVSETAVAGYGASFGLACGNAGAITINAGDDLDCLLVNDDSGSLTTQLTIQKIVINDSNGPALGTDDFQYFLDGNAVTLGQQTSNTAFVTLDVTPGTHLVVESPSFGYTASFSGNCAADGTVTVAAGSSATCVITNDDIASGQNGSGDLTIVENIVNDDGGPAFVSNVAVFIDGIAVGLDQVDAQNASRTFATTTGSHVVQVNVGFDGYAVTFSGACDASGQVNVAAGSQTCTVTIDDIPPTLNFTKNVVNDNGQSGNLGVQNFQLFINGSPIQDPNAQPGSTITHVLTPGIGTHVLSETQLFGYFGTFSGDCDANGIVSLAVGETKTCVLTNDDFAVGQAGTAQLTIVETINNGDGGQATSDHFQQFLDGIPFSSGPAGQSVSRTFTVAANVQHTVQANFGIFTNYTITLGGACDTSGNITLGDGSSGTCTITIDDIPGRGGNGGGPTDSQLVLTQTIIGGPSTMADVTTTLDGSTVTTNNQTTTSSVTTFVVTPGTHVAGASITGGYATTIGGACAPSGVVAGTFLAIAGTTANCSITFTFPGASANLNVAVNVINHGGTTQPSNVTVNVTGTNPNPSSFPGASAGTVVLLDPGAYDAQSVAVAGYTATRSADCTGTAVLGESKACVITLEEIVSGGGDNGSGGDDTGSPVITVTGGSGGNGCCSSGSTGGSTGGSVAGATDNDGNGSSDTGSGAGGTTDDGQVLGASTDDEDGAGSGDIDAEGGDLPRTGTGISVLVLAGLAGILAARRKRK